MAECPQYHRFSLDFDARTRRARCLYSADCGYATSPGSVSCRDDFYTQFGHGERLVGEEPPLGKPPEGGA